MKCIYGTDIDNNAINILKKTLINKKLQYDNKEKDISISFNNTSFNAASTLEPLRANPILLAAVKVNPSSGMLRFCLTISINTISSSIDGMSSIGLLFDVAIATYNVGSMSTESKKNAIANFLSKKGW